MNIRLKEKEKKMKKKIEKAIDLFNLIFESFFKSLIILPIMFVIIMFIYIVRDNLFAMDSIMSLIQKDGTIMLIISIGLSFVLTLFANVINECGI